MYLVQNRGRETWARSRNAVNYETTAIVGEDVVADTALAILILIIRGYFELINVSSYCGSQLMIIIQITKVETVVSD